MLDSSMSQGASKTAKTTSIRNAALSYARRAWLVMPLWWPLPDGRCSCGNPACTSAGKHPVEKGWQELATTNEATIRAWWRRRPKANIGIPTGERSGLLVLDVDGEEGKDALADLEARYGPLPETVESITGAGGRHIFFRYPAGRNIPNKARFYPGLDTRSTGGLIAAPPSLHVSGRRYTWEVAHHPNDVPLADCPEWLLKLMEEKPERQTAKKMADHIPEGERNATLTSLAGTMRRRGMSQEAIDAALWVENQSRCVPPLDRGEVTRIASSVGQYRPAEKNQYFCKDDGPTYGEWSEVLAQTKYTLDATGNLCYEKFSKNGAPELIPIANFLARPVREITRDNGLEAEKTFEITGFLAGGVLLPAVAVSAKDFASMSWVTASWGLGANVEPGAGAKDKVRHAIQCLARDVERETVYTHLGWRKIGSCWAYLHAGGAIGAESVTVDVSADRLDRYTLPETADHDAVNWSLKLFDIAHPEVTVPLFSLVYLAPLCEPLRIAGVEPAFILWASGVTGSMKSTLSALLLCHFGNFTGKNLPASFKDTGNSLEKKAFLTKDSLLVVDDYHPTASQLEARKMEQTAQQLLRGYGDRVGRGRMRADMSLRPSYVPRGLCLVTGEDAPDAGQSTTARYLIVELKKGGIDTALLNELQGNTDKLAQAMRGYIEWLSPRLDEIPAKLRERFVQFRQKATMEGQHTRMPEVVAWLYIGLHSGLDYAEGIGVIEKATKKEWLAAGWRVLLALAGKQAKRIEEDRPAQKFVSILGELMASGAVYTLDVGEPDLKEKAPGFIGWHDEQWFYFLPEVVYREVSTFCRAQGVQFPVTARTLWKHLDVEGLIFNELTGGEVRRLAQKKVAGKRYRVLQMCRGALGKDVFE